MSIQQMETASTLSKLFSYYKSLSQEEQEAFWSGLPVDVIRLWYSGQFMGMKQYKVNAADTDFFLMSKEKQYPAVLAWFKIMKKICPPSVPAQVFRIAYVGKPVRGKFRYKPLSPLSSWTASYDGLSTFLHKLPTSVARKKFTDPGFVLLTLEPPPDIVLISHESVNEFAQAYVQLYKKLKPKLNKEDLKNLMISLKIVVPTLKGTWGKMEEVVCFMKKAYPVIASDPKDIRSQVL